MKVLIKERLSPNKYVTHEGYLICKDAILARTGKQQYRKSEVFDTFDGDDDIIDIDRNPKEVFSDATLASFENKPITVEHPQENVDSTNWKQYQVGFVRDVKRDVVDGQDVILGTLVIQDKDTIDEILNGEHTDLSCGYECDIVGDDKTGYSQINIRGNHVALCQEGRAGIARIVDSKIEDKLVGNGEVHFLYQGSKIQTNVWNKDDKSPEELLAIARKHDCKIKPIDRDWSSVWLIGKKGKEEELCKAWHEINSRYSVEALMSMHDSDSVNDSDELVVGKWYEFANKIEVARNQYAKSLRISGKSGNVYRYTIYLKNGEMYGSGTYSEIKEKFNIIDSIVDSKVEDSDNTFDIATKAIKEHYKHIPGATSIKHVEYVLYQYTNLSKEQIKDFLSKFGSIKNLKALGVIDSIKDVKFTVYNEDDDFFGRFDTKEEAKKQIKELKAFDKRQGNPFDEVYRIEVEDSVCDQNLPENYKKCLGLFKKVPYKKSFSEAVDYIKSQNYDEKTEAALINMVIDYRGNGNSGFMKALHKEVEDSVEDSVEDDFYDKLFSSNLKYEFIKGGYGIKFKTQRDYQNAKEIAKRTHYTKGKWYDKDLEFFEYGGITISNEDSIYDSDNIVDRQFNNNDVDAKQIVDRKANDGSYEGFEIRNRFGHYEAIKNGKIVVTADTETELRKEIDEIVNTEQGDCRMKDDRLSPMTYKQTNAIINGFSSIGFNLTKQHDTDMKNYVDRSLIFEHKVSKNADDSEIKKLHKDFITLLNKLKNDKVATIGSFGFSYEHDKVVADVSFAIIKNAKNSNDSMHDSFVEEPRAKDELIKALSDYKLTDEGKTVTGKTYCVFKSTKKFDKVGFNKEASRIIAFVKNIKNKYDLPDTTYSIGMKNDGTIVVVVDLGTKYVKDSIAILIKKATTFIGLTKIVKIIKNNKDNK